MGIDNLGMREREGFGLKGAITVFYFPLCLRRSNGIIPIILYQFKAYSGNSPSLSRCFGYFYSCFACILRIVFDDLHTILGIGRLGVVKARGFGGTRVPTRIGIYVCTEYSIPRTWW